MSGFSLSIALVLLGASCANAQDGVREAAQSLTLGALELADGRVDQAIASFQSALDADPASFVAALDLAIAHLAAGHLDLAFELASQRAADGDQSAAARYVVGCIHMRRQEWEQASVALRSVRGRVPFVAAVHFQLGWVAEKLGRADVAAESYREAVRLDRKHGAASYRLSVVLADLGELEQAAASLAAHRRLLADRPPIAGGRLPTRETYEACELLEPRVPFVRQPPATAGIPVRFSGAAERVVGGARLRAPLCTFDAGLDGDLDVIAATAGGGLVLLANTEGRLVGAALPGGGTGFAQVLAGDVDNDGIEDVLALGPAGCKLWRFDAQGHPADATTSSGVGEIRARGGILVDLDHTGSLDLVTRDGHDLRFFRNTGAGIMAATDAWKLPNDAGGSLALADLDDDDLVEVLVALGPGEGLRSLRAQRGLGVFFAETSMPWGPATRVACNDLDGDLRGDGVTLRNRRLELWIADRDPRTIADDVQGHELTLFDHDNDGWLDLLVAGGGVRLWRNLGGGAFREVTAAVGLDAAELSDVQQALPLDIDADGDLDLLVARARGGLELRENAGGDANHSLSVRLRGTRSNGNGIGARLELHASGLRTSRMVSRLPVHLGLGSRQDGLVLNVVWLDQTFQLADVEFTPGAVIEIVEPYVETGSCPYLYAWDGKRFRFVTDILGVAPLGLPLDGSTLVSADPDELVRIGGAEALRPRDGHYELRVTEELREVLYLDQVELVVADHPQDVEVHSTDKLRPPPFPRSELVPLHRRRELLAAEGDGRTNLRDALAEIDGHRASPPRLLGPHLRGMAEPWSISLDFGGLDDRVDLVLALTGWLRYGGATGNMAASEHPHVAQPTPVLDAQDADGVWRRLPLVVGLPAGKTKTILVELADTVPPGARRLRLTTGFDVHWDRIALFERHEGVGVAVTRLGAASARLRWHGHGAVEPAPRSEPVTASYDRLRPTPPWRWTPAGCFTRYGAVDDLVREADDRLALLAAGDEVALSFSANALPPCPQGRERTFFFHSVGWDKDADVHCVAGLTVEPLPFHGMDDQLYGFQERPAELPRAWIDQFNTRLVPAAVPGTGVR